MIEDSELAKTIRKDEQKKAEDQVSSSPSPLAIDTNLASPERKDNDILTQAISCKAELEMLLARSPSSSSATTSPTDPLDPELRNRAQTILASLASLIETTGDPSHLEELLTLNDELTSLMSFASYTPPAPSLNGLGIRIDTTIAATVSNGNGHAVPVEGDVSDSDEIYLLPRDWTRGRGELGLSLRNLKRC
ncbi:hypothetical protein QCA50_005504 [Cerrena zonata]|uniref:Uncharacterized protein n=1 Tax=Cerrena zonata TaxID=2478898 RepID=A0AAW0GF25_9APHY